MNVTPASVAISIVFVTIVITWVFRIVNWIWLRPRRLEKYLRDQGLRGNRYRFLFGDLRDLFRMRTEAKSKHFNISDDIVPCTLPYFDYLSNKYGKNFFLWMGPYPRLNIMDPDLIKEIYSKHDIFQKPSPEPVRDLIIGGLLSLEDEKWAKHRKMIKPAFHLEKLKNMVPAMYSSCQEMITKLDMLIPESGTSEVNVFPYLDDLSGDMISRTAFGSNHADGKRIFQLQKEQVSLLGQLFLLIYIPGWRFLPFKPVRRFKHIKRELDALLRCMITKRQTDVQMGEEINKDDLLGILLDSNSKEIKESGYGMSMSEVIEECKLFYFAGSETTSSLLSWTMILLSRYPNWQTQAREEVFQVFGNNKPHFDGLNHLKIVTMIFYEVLRLYPPVVMSVRGTTKETKLGNITLAAGMRVMLPILMVHHDQEIWGEDASQFKPERFSEGVSSATKGKITFFPFGGGPRICMGQTFAIIEAKMAISMILQRFSFEISRTYKHSPFPAFTLPPQFGAQLIMHRI